MGFQTGALPTPAPAEVEQFLRENYTDVSRHPPAGSLVHFRYDTIATESFALDRITSTSGFELGADAPADFVVDIVRRGRLSVAPERRSEMRLGESDVALAPTVGRYHNVVEPIALDVVALDAGLVAEHAVVLSPTAPETFEFTELSPLSPAMAHFWRATVTHVRDDVLADPVLAAQPIIVGNAFRQLASALLFTFPNSASEALLDPHTTEVTGHVGDTTLRAVVDLVEEHADEPLGPADLAQVADAPYRDVAAALRRRRAHPAELLWQARLRGVHRHLLDADPDTADPTAAVAALAARWGFADVGTFTAAYTRATAGETPEQTLRR